MPIKMVKRFTAFSFSRLTDYEQCPLRARLKHLDKVPEPDKPVFQRGRDIEEAAYKYIFDKKGIPLPEACAAFPEEFAFLRKIRKSVLSQRDMAFDKDWRPVDWFAKDAWIRVRMDLMYEELVPGSKKHHRVHVIDLKTGKIYEDKLSQLDIYNLAALCLDDSIVTHGSKVSVAEMYYLDQGETRERALMASEVEKAKAYWVKRVTPMFNDTSFLPRPSMMCKWCQYAKSKGGVCPY